MRTVRSRAAGKGPSGAGWSAADPPPPNSLSMATGTSSGLGSSASGETGSVSSRSTNGGGSLWGSGGGALFCVFQQFQRITEQVRTTPTTSSISNLSVSTTLEHSYYIFTWPEMRFNQSKVDKSSTTRFNMFLKA